MDSSLLLEANMAIGWCNALAGATRRIEHTAIYGAIFF